MLSKDQEREALKRIENIIKEAGPDSYIGMTFAGIVEQAADNITNDFANNYKELYEAQTKNLVEANKTIKALKDEQNDLKEQMKTVTAALEAAQDKFKEYQHKIDDVRTEKNETTSKLMHATEANEAQKTEIITLKAKLYDLMTK